MSLRLVRNPSEPSLNKIDHGLILKDSRPGESPQATGRSGMTYSIDTVLMIVYIEKV